MYVTLARLSKSMLDGSGNDVNCNPTYPDGQRQQDAYKIQQPTSAPGNDTTTQQSTTCRHSSGVQGAMDVPADEPHPGETSCNVTTPAEDHADAILQRIIDHGIDDELLESLRCLEVDVSEDELMALGLKARRMQVALDSGAGEHVA